MEPVAFVLSLLLAVWFIYGLLRSIVHVLLGDGGALPGVLVVVLWLAMAVAVALVVTVPLLVRRRLRYRLCLWVACLEVLSVIGLLPGLLQLLRLLQPSVRAEFRALGESGRSV